MDDISKLQSIIDNSKKIVAFTGAGVSTESGIKDFRGKDGISKFANIPVEILLSHTYYENNTSDFFKYYKLCFNCLDKKPNDTHKYLKKLEDEGKLIGIITQNVDGLHTKAGSKNVCELHGSIYKNTCLKCGKKYGPEEVFDREGIPKCECGGIIKPDVVLYEEALPYEEVAKADELVRKADTLIVLGTSLVVYPAAAYVDRFTGDNLVIINVDKTTYDKEATLVIHDKLSNVMSKLK